MTLDWVLLRTELEGEVRVVHQLALLQYHHYDWRIVEFCQEHQRHTLS